MHQERSPVIVQKGILSIRNQESVKVNSMEILWFRIVLEKRELISP